MFSRRLRSKGMKDLQWSDKGVFSRLCVLSIIMILRAGTVEPIPITLSFHDELVGGVGDAVQGGVRQDGITESFMIPLSSNAWLVGHSFGVE